MYKRQLLQDWEQQEVALRRFADCVVRAEPSQAHTLVWSRIGSRSEDDAFAALAPQMSGCLSKDRQLRFTKISLRGVIGETLYRLRTASSGEG